MTLPLILVACVVLMALMFPKLGRRAKRRRPIPLRSVFKRRDNPFKNYHLRHDADDTAMFAARCADKNRRKKLTPATKALMAVLNDLGVKYKREVVLHNRLTGAWCIADFVLPDRRMVIELDGFQHRFQKGYDVGRDQWIREFSGYAVARFWNSWATEPGLRDRVILLLGL